MSPGEGGKQDLQQSQQGFWFPVNYSDVFHALVAFKEQTHETLSITVRQQLWFLLLSLLTLPSATLESSSACCCFWSELSIFIFFSISLYLTIIASYHRSSLVPLLHTDQLHHRICPFQGLSAGIPSTTHRTYSDTHYNPGAYIAKPHPHVMLTMVVTEYSGRVVPLPKVVVKSTNFCLVMMTDAKNLCQMPFTRRRRSAACNLDLAPLSCVL